MSDSPAAVLVDVSGNLMAVTSSMQVPSGATGLIFAGVGEDGTVRYPVIDSDGNLRVLTGSAPALQQVTGAVHITNLPLLVTGNVGIGKPITLERGSTVGTPLFVSGTVGIGKPVTVTGSVNVNSQLTVTSTASLGVALTRSDITSSVTGTVVAVGPTASGSVPTTNPVLIGGYDGSNVQTLRTNISGRSEVVLYDGSGNAVGVELDGSVYRLQAESKLRGLLSTNNSSSTPLSGSATFTGTADDVTDYAIAYVTVHSDVASAADGLVVEQSSDGINWDHQDWFTIPAATGKTFSFQCAARYLRVRYTNGVSAQSTFRLQTVYKQVYGKSSTHRIQDPIVDEDDAELVKAVLVGEDSAGVFRDASVSVDGTVKRLEITGKVTVVGPSPPPATTAVVIFGDTPLKVGRRDSTLVVPNGQTFYLQEIVCGNENPTRGAVVEVIWYDGSEHLVARVYIAGFTVTTGYPDQSVTRDGTTMLGNGTNYVILRRKKYRGSNIAIDAIVRGYMA